MKTNLYTLVKLFFDKDDNIIERLDIVLDPMTLDEAYTMKSKQTNPVEWQVVKVKDQGVTGER